MSFIGFLIIILILVCFPFYIIYAIYIRRGTGISWWKSYIPCPKCNFKLSIDSHYNVKLINEFYEYECKDGSPDMRYKENSLIKEKIYYYKCSSCLNEFEIEDTEWE